MDSLLQEWVDKGRRFKQQGDFTSAIVCFENMLKEDVDNPLALNELYKCCLCDRRKREAIDAMNRLMAIYIRQEKKSEALTLYGELMQTDGDHSFQQEAQTILIDWLEAYNDHAGAITAVKNYVKRYPHDRHAAGILNRGIAVAEAADLSDAAAELRMTLENDYSRDD